MRAEYVPASQAVHMLSNTDPVPIRYLPAPQSMHLENTGIRVLTRFGPRRREEEEEEEEEDLVVFNDTIEGPRAPAVKPEKGDQKFRYRRYKSIFYRTFWSLCDCLIRTSILTSQRR